MSSGISVSRNKDKQTCVIETWGDGTKQSVILTEFNFSDVGVDFETIERAQEYLSLHPNTKTTMSYWALHNDL